MFHQKVAAFRRHRPLFHPFLCLLALWGTKKPWFFLEGHFQMGNFCSEFIAIRLRGIARTSFLYSTASGTAEPLPLFKIYFVNLFSASYFSLLLTSIRLQFSVSFAIRRSSTASKLASDLSRLMSAAFSLPPLFTSSSETFTKTKQSSGTLSSLKRLPFTPPAHLTQATFLASVPNCPPFSSSSAREPSLLSLSAALSYASFTNRAWCRHLAICLLVL